MKSIWKPGLFFLLCLLLGLLINMPASQVLARINLPTNISVLQLKGSLYAGQIEQLVVDGFAIEGIQYRNQLSCLLLLKLCYRVEHRNGSTRLAYAVLSDAVEVSEFDANYELEQLTQNAAQLLVKPSGSLEINLVQARLVQGRLTDIDGSLLWKDAGLAGEDINLGNYLLSLTRENNQFQAEVSDLDALLDIGGTGELRSNGNYALNLSINAPVGLDSRVKSALEFVASRKGLNQFLVNRNGKLTAQQMGYFSLEAE